jgi:TATA-box binding protein (TBP) (component of TFIID and TFIIIB)
MCTLLSRLEDQKTLILLYWEIMMSFMGCKKFSSIVLVLENYLTILQQLSLLTRER